MSNRTFEVTVLERHCKGCGLCVEVCTQGKLSIDPRPSKQGIQVVVAAVEIDCTGCTKCALVCPHAAIEIRESIGVVSGSG